MTFPERPTCHDVDWQAQRFGGATWRPATTHVEMPWRSCSFCGSMHPEDLLRAIENGATMHGSDWKYGWPHKFYIEVPNPEPDKDFVVGHERGPGVDRDIIGKRPTFHGKFYSVHLRDLGFDADTHARLLEAIDRETHIRFRLDGEKLMYGAPRPGYQKP